MCYFVIDMFRIIAKFLLDNSRFFFGVRNSKKQSHDSTDLHFSLWPLRIWPFWTRVLTGVYLWFMSSQASKHIGDRAHFPARHKTRG